MAYTPPSPFIFTVESGYSPPTPFVFRVGEPETLIANGSVVQPVDSVSSVAVSPNACTGDFRQPVDSVSGNQQYVAGDFQGLVDSVIGEAVSPLVAVGIVDPQADSVYGGIDNSAPPIDWVAGSFYSLVNKVSGSASNPILVGRFSPQVDALFGTAITPSVCTGRVIQRGDSVSGFGFISKVLGDGNYSQSVDTVRGDASTPIVAKGRVVQRTNVLLGSATSPIVRFGDGRFLQRRDGVSGAAFSIIPATGQCAQKVDSVDGDARSVNVCRGGFVQSSDKVKGSVRGYRDSVNLSFGRDEIELPTISGLPPTPLHFDRGTAVTGTTNPSTITPLEFSR